MNNILGYLIETERRYPDKKSVALGDVSYTFSELVRFARRMGAVWPLSELKNKPIAVMAGREPETIGLFFGVLFSGNFYVPVDPELPKEKLASILENAGISVILGLPQYRSAAETAGFTGTYLTPDDGNGEECGFPSGGGDGPCYMVYTSGSTGKPKGVLKSHGAVISFVEAYCDRFGFGPEEIIGNQTPFFFDASMKDIILMMKTGASVEILPPQLFMMPPELIDYLNEKKITFCSWVPSALSIVARLNPFSVVKPKTLKRVFFVGEVMPIRYLNVWRRELPDILYVNLYGQSELAGICCCYEVSGTFADSDMLPMGKPLKNAEIFLVDEGKIVHEPGRTGEIFLVSDALALGYYGDEQKTADVFLTRDFGNGSVRCFRTGDFAKYDAEGNLLFAARADAQIKHMGHRIELGEIEAAASGLKEVQRCCCLYQEEKKKIVLFCELTTGSVCTGTEIQSRLRTRLSSYMVPGRVVVSERLPLTANGKIDRQLLKSGL